MTMLILCCHRKAILYQFLNIRLVGALCLPIPASLRLSECDRTGWKVVISIEKGQASAQFEPLCWAA